MTDGILRAADNILERQNAELRDKLHAAELLNAEMNAAYTECRNNASAYATEMGAKLEAAEKRIAELEAERARLINAVQNGWTIENAEEWCKA